MCSPVEHYVCFYLIFFLYGHPGKKFLAFSPVKTIIGVPVKKVYLNYTTVYCACSLPFVSVET